MRILVCPLNWGLGHASRDIVIIQKLMDRGHQVIVATDGPALELLRGEFPGLDYIQFRSLIHMTYLKSFPAWLKILMISPLLGFEILREHYQLKSIIRKTGVSMVISDNRYGLWHKHIPAVLITHQLRIRVPVFTGILDPLMARLTNSMIRRFQACWVPDYDGPANLAGELAHNVPLPENVAFIGPLSRFSAEVSPNFPMVQSEKDSSDTEVELVVLLSGPEPQRSVLEEIILNQVKEIQTTCVILQGLPGKNMSREVMPGYTMYSHLPTHEIKSLLMRAKYIVCRSGYTSIMDLVALGKTAMLIPTPGQTEQEYLADYLSRKEIFLSMKQKKLNLNEAIRQLEAFRNKIETHQQDLLEAELDRWFEKKEFQALIDHQG